MSSGLARPFTGVVFIGGSMDGKRISLHELPSILRYPVIVELDGDMIYEDERYVRSSLSGSSERFVVYTAEGLSGDDVMRSLLAGYKRS